MPRRGRTHTIDSQTRVQGSKLDAGGDLRVQAGNDHQRDEVHDIRAVGTDIHTGGDLLIASGGDQTYQGARLSTDGDLALLSGGAIHFDTASDIRSESHERSRSNFAWQSARGEGSTRETLRQSELVAQGEMVIQAAQGITIDVPEVNAQSVRQVIDAMAEANPDLAWLQEMEARGDVDWRQVEAIHESWNYSQSGLGPGAALAVSIVAAAWAGPAASQLVSGMITHAGSAAVAGSMAGAAAGSLAGTGAVGMINQRGDLGAALGDTLSSDSLRGAALAALSAGATQGMTDHVWGTQTNTTTGATTNLSLGEWGDIGRFAGQRATQAAIDAGLRTAIDAGLRTAIEGGSFQGHLGDSFESAVAHVVSGVLFNAVGDLANDHLWQEGDPQKIALHALIGGSISEAMGGDFATGALAAGASEALVHELVGDASRVEFSNAAAQIVGIVAAELAGGDVHDGAFIAGQVESYNRQLHTQERELARDLAEASDGQFTLEEIEGAMRGMYNDALNETPSSNIVIDLWDDLDSIRAASFDTGGEWMTLAGADGNARVLMQVFPTDTPPDLIAYIIEQTGGDDSPYRTAVYQLPAEDAAPGQPRDRLTGRPLNEDGQYIVSYMMDGKVFPVPHFPCGDARCVAEGANIDYSDPAAQAYSKALDAKALKDLSYAATLATMINPIGGAAFGVGLSGSAENVVSGYLSDSFIETASAEVAQYGFEKYAIARGMPQAQAIRFANALSLVGFWDNVVDNAKNMGNAP